MKTLPWRIVLMALIIITGCAGNKEPDVVYEYVEKERRLSPELEEQIGSWAGEGMDCYGILALVDREGVMHEGAVIEARILRFNGDSVKMRSLESRKLREVEGCDKMGISRGDTWWETEGDIFRTAEEAEAKLKKALSESTPAIPVPVPN